MKPTELSFKTLCQFFEAVAKAPRNKKLIKLRSLLEKNLERESDELYEVFRLILPYRDKHRGNYDLKEAKLVLMLCKAVSVDTKQNMIGKIAVNWRQPSTAGKVNKNAGNFAAVMEEQLFIGHCKKQEGTPGERELKIGQLNQKLDELVAAKGDEKVNVLRWLITHTSPSMMRWIICIILKDLKISLGEATLFREYHPDAEALFNMTMDLKKVILDLRDKNYRLPKRDIEPGRPVRPQLAGSVYSAKEAFARMKGRPFVIDTKFDGERMQLHRAGDKVFYWSRTATEHGEQYGYRVFDEVLKAQVNEETCVLDGEMMAWNKTRKKFEPFGGLKSAFKLANSAAPITARVNIAARGEDDDSQPSEDDPAMPTVADLEIMYVAFDVLFAGGQSVMDRPLRERQAILDRLVAEAPAEGFPLGKSALKGRILALLPQRPFIDGALASREAHSEEDVAAAFEEAAKLEEEGIVVKNLDSAWMPNDRSNNNWVKLKPDYVHQSDIDAVVIGGRWGAGRNRAGGIAEYLLALAEPPPPEEEKPRIFVSFCRVGTGLNVEERKDVDRRLQPLFIENKATSKKHNAPKCYRVTNSSEERPDVWISDPYKSIVFKVAGDTRKWKGIHFATQYTLRFGRILAIRDDKTAAEVLTVADYEAMMEEVGTEGLGQMEGKKRKRGAAATPKPPKPDGWPSVASDSYVPADVSKVAQTSQLLEHMKIHVLSYGEGQKSKAAVGELVKSLGGQVYMSMARAVTHYLTEAPDAWQVQYCAKNHQDVLSLDWLLEVAAKGAQFHPRPRDYVHLTRETRHSDPEMDAFGDLFSVDCDAVDMDALFERHITMEDVDLRRLRPDGWNGPFTATDLAVQVDVEMAAAGHPPPLTSLFRGCRICVLPDTAGAPTDPGLQKLRLNYLQSLVRLCGGRITDAIEPSTTHLVWLREGASSEPRALLQQIAAEANGIAALTNLWAGLESGSLQIAAPSWLEDSFERAAGCPPEVATRRLPESEHLHQVVQSCTSRPEDWPWTEFGVEIARQSPESSSHFRPSKKLKPSRAFRASPTPQPEASGSASQEDRPLGAARVVSKRRRTGFGPGQGFRDFGFQKPGQKGKGVRGRTAEERPGKQMRTAGASQPQEPPKFSQIMPPPQLPRQTAASQATSSQPERHSEQPLSQKPRGLIARLRQTNTPPPATASQSRAFSPLGASEPSTSAASGAASQPAEPQPTRPRLLDALLQGEDEPPIASSSISPAPVSATLHLGSAPMDAGGPAVSAEQQPEQQPNPVPQPSGLFAALMRGDSDEDEEQPGSVSEPAVRGGSALGSASRGDVDEGFPPVPQPSRLLAALLRGDTEEQPGSASQLSQPVGADLSTGKEAFSRSPSAIVAAGSLTVGQGSSISPPASQQPPARGQEVAGAGGSERQGSQAASLSPQPRKKLTLRERMEARRNRHK